MMLRYPPTQVDLTPTDIKSAFRRMEKTQKHGKLPIYVASDPTQHLTLRSRPFAGDQYHRNQSQESQAHLPRGFSPYGAATLLKSSCPAKHVEPVVEGSSARQKGVVHTVSHGFNVDAADSPEPSNQNNSSLQASKQCDQENNDTEAMMALTGEFVAHMARERDILQRDVLEETPPRETRFTRLIRQAFDS